MSDNPIYDGVGRDDETAPYEDTDSMHVEETQSGHWITSLAGRRYVYGIATTVLAVLAVYFGIDAATQENWLALAGAVLNLGGAGATILAGRNVR